MSRRAPAVVTAVERRTVRCERCDRPIEVCAFCQDPACRMVICYTCLREQLRQSLPQPHVHGG